MGKLRGVMAGVFLGGVLLGGIGTGIAMVEYSTLYYGGEHLIGEEYLVTKNLDFEFPQDGKILVVRNVYYNYSVYKDITVETDDSVPVGMVRYEITYNEKNVTPELVFQEYEDEEEEVGEEFESEVPGEGNGEGIETEAAGEEDGEESGAETAGEGDGDGIETDETKERLGEAQEPASETYVEREPVYLGMVSLISHSCADGFETLMENKDLFLKELKEKKISRYRQVYITDLKVKVNPQTMPFIEVSDTWPQFR